MTGLSRRCFLGTWVLGALGTALPVRADDSMAELDTGGRLILQASDRIRLARQDLFLSLARVHVRFAFQNLDSTSVQGTLAFVLPDMTGEDLARHDLEQAGGVLAVTGFQLAVAGQPVPVTPHVRALVGHRDITDLLTRAGLPADYTRKDFPARLAALSPAARQRLQQAGVPLDAFAPGGAFWDRWRLRVRFLWPQTFPPGQMITITHRYRPAAGAMILEPGLPPQATAPWCLPAHWPRLLAGASGTVPIARDLRYTLTTGRQWAGGQIGRLTLTIQLPDAETTLFTCFSGLERQGPRQYGGTWRSYRPDQDLRLLFVRRE